MANFEDLTVDSFTTPCPKCVKGNQSIDDVFDLMHKEGFRHVPVENEKNEIIGLVSQRDLAALKSFKFYQPLAVEDVMVDAPATVRAGSLLSEAVFKMSEEKIGSLVVLDESGKIDGIFTSTDALNALVEVLRGEVFS